jgi:hypothetical protein
MDALQFSLFFVALLVGYVLVHLRMIRFEEHLQKLAGIRGLDDRLRSVDDRLRALAEAFDKLHLERIEGHLTRLHEDLEDLREATAELRHAVVQIPSVAPDAARSGDGDGDVLPAAAPESPGARTIAIVEGRLLQMGYQNLRLLTELGEVVLAGETEIQVECERGGMPVKGRVVVRNGSVRDVLLQPVTQMFP